MPTNIFVTARLPGSSLERLSEKYEVRVFEANRLPTYEELRDGASEADALISMVSDPVDKPLIEACPRLRIISNCGVGYENVDVGAATERGIFVTNTPGVLTETVADLAWGLILAVARRIPEADAFVREGKFVGWLPTLLLGVSVHKKTLGIFGMGTIGTAIARRAKGFNMDVLYHNRGRNKPAEDELGARQVEFETLLQESDIVVISAPLNEQTLGRFGRDEFSLMKPTSILINVGRGQIVRERALAEALKKGEIWGAGLDVFEREPEVEETLIGLPNVVLLPHLGSASRETREKMAEMAVTSVERALEGKAPEFLVNPDVNPDASKPTTK